MKTLKLTNAQINHILTLIDVNEREGWYSGNRKHFHNRNNELKFKLNNLKATNELKKANK